MNRRHALRTCMRAALAVSLPAVITPCLLAQTPGESSRTSSTTARTPSRSLTSGNPSILSQRSFVVRSGRSRGRYRFGRRGLTRSGFYLPPFPVLGPGPFPLITPGLP
jgi:hypothetical protein